MKVFTGLYCKVVLNNLKDKHDNMILEENDKNAKWKKIHQRIIW